MNLLWTGIGDKSWAHYVTKSIIAFKIYPMMTLRLGAVLMLFMLPKR